jgi:hypothetical protein
MAAGARNSFMEYTVEGGVSSNGGSLRADVFCKDVIPHGDGFKDLALDVTVFHPQSDSDMERKERLKVAKYEEQAQKNGRTVFLPFAAYTYGGIGPAGCKALHCISLAQVRSASTSIDEPSNSLYDKAAMNVHLTCLQRVSVALQTGVIQGIRKAVRQAQGHHSRHAGNAGRPDRMRPLEPWKLVELCRRKEASFTRAKDHLVECGAKPVHPLLPGDSQLGS